MTYFKIINGDLLTATETYIVHQCNCISTSAKALAESLFNEYLYANTYSKRIRNNITTYSKPSTIDILGNGITQRYIINMYAQYYPGIAKYNNDTKEKRIIWFKECLDHISQIKNIKQESIAMAYNTGCAAAGGDWIIYSKMIEDFANKEQICVTLYRL